MRRLALLAAVVVVACSPKKDDGGGDHTAPDVPVILAPAGGALLGPADLSMGNVGVSGTAEAGATIEVRLDSTAAGTAVANGAGAWSISLSAADGAHIVDARATDAAGNGSAFSGAVSFTVDTVGPDRPVVLLPAVGAALNAADLVAGFVVVSGTAEPGATVEVELDGVVAGSSVATAGGAWSVAIEAADGGHALHARATDAAGNLSAYSGDVSFALDATPPADPTIVAPAQGALLAAQDLVSGEVVFAGTAEPGANVAVQVDGAAVGAAVAAPGTGAWTLAAAVPDGDHAVRAAATDPAGNSSGLAPAVSFGLDSVAPAIPVVLAPADGAALTTADLVGGRVVVSGTADADATVEVLVDGAPAGSGAATGGAWAVHVLVDSGAHTVAGVARDAAGNASVASTASSFTLDSTRLAYPLPPGSAPGVTSFGQTVAAVSPSQEVFPAQANSWNLDRDFSLAQNMGFQYANALVLYVGTPTGATYSDLLAELGTAAFHQFPGDQLASDPVFLTPFFGAADGVVTAAASDGVAMGSPALSGATSGFLNGTSDSRLSRALALTPGHTYKFAWTHKVVARQGSLSGADAAPYAPSYRVVLRDATTGSILGAPLYAASADVPQESVSIPRSGLPAAVVLSFELRSAAEGYAELDDVKLFDGATEVPLANGDFEAGLAGWDVNAGAESQNVRSAPRDVFAGASALRVTRTFYAPPASAWARLVDVFENPGAAAVSTTAVYLTALQGWPPLAALTEGGAAVVGWDPAGAGRDVGIVLGTGTAMVEAGSPIVLVAHDLTVPAGQRVALVHFVVQLGEAAGGATAADVPAGTGAECAAAVAGFAAQEPYRIDLEPGVLGSVVNF